MPECAEHKYEHEFLPCPNPECKNGHVRDLWKRIDCRGVALGATYDEYEFPEPEIFFRDRDNGVWRWRKVVDATKVTHA